ncbi:MAG: leucyl aminopeptidase family protein [Steroidobacteraceae bacterium]|jgi:leucyl aminopeptidase|nr:leucyl aminopeptidase family protein [Steroidobacteraceae bacterium]
MPEFFTRQPGPASRPLWLVRETDLDAWRAALPPSVAAWVRESGFAAERHRVLLLPGPDGSLVGSACGLGALHDWDSLRPAAVAGLPERLPQGQWHLETPLPPRAATHALLGWIMGSYRFDRYRNTRASALRSVTLAAPAGADVEHALRAGEADALARDLVNTPAADMGPEQLAAEAAALASRHGAKLGVLSGAALLDAGLEAIHTVGRAGPQAPRLIDLTWGELDHPRVTLVGKGVCFDSGGLDLKAASAMLLMKKDMGGAAMALAVAHMVMDARLPVRLRVLVPAVENSVGSNAFRPGDIIRTRKGITVEVGNTDAEGRLVLADALSLADDEHPDLLLDFATLTGAARVALGPELPALFSNDDDLAAGLEASGRAEGDPLWRMPLWPSYDEELASKVADINNVTTSGFAGAIIGALFLQRFVSATRAWAHLDLYAWNPRERPGRPVGAEAQCVRTAYRLIQRRFAAAG